MALEIVEAHRDLVPVIWSLFKEYADSLDFDLNFQGFGEEMENLPGDYAPPRGCMLVAFQDGQAAGCIALRPLDGETCELKRLYVRPGFQGRRIGWALTTAVIQRAAECRYQAMRLDTVSSMKAAIQLYRSVGFYPIAPYCKNPLPGAQFFEMQLKSRWGPTFVSVSEDFKVTAKGLSHFYKDSEGEARFSSELHSVRAGSATLILYKKPDIPPDFHPAEEWLSRACARVKAFMEAGSAHVIEVD